jgi:hypothetical protein
MNDAKLDDAMDGSQNRPLGALCVVAIVVGLALVPTLPYGYYTVARWVVCAACAWIALGGLRCKEEIWVWIWAVIAGVYNPIVPVHATRAVWVVVNVATIALVVAYAARPRLCNLREKHE